MLESGAPSSVVLRGPGLSIYCWHQNIQIHGRYLPHHSLNKRKLWQHKNRKLFFPKKWFKNHYFVQENLNWLTLDESKWKSNSLSHASLTDYRSLTWCDVLWSFSQKVVWEPVSDKTEEPRSMVLVFSGSSLGKKPQLCRGKISHRHLIQIKTIKTVSMSLQILHMVDIVPAAHCISWI